MAKRTWIYNIVTEVTALELRCLRTVKKFLRISLSLTYYYAAGRRYEIYLHHDSIFRPSSGIALIHSY